MAERTAELAPPLGAARAASGRRLIVRELGVLPYGEALAMQEALAAEVAAGTAGEHLLLLEHPPVYTLGRGADAADLLGAPDRLGVPVFRVGRGGGVTFHGPGQLVAYPIVRLAAAGRDVHRYVRDLEAVLIATCARFGIAATAPEGQTGIWVGERKLGSIGIGVRRGVAHHGIALNVATDVSYFAHIVTCRMPGLALTSIAEQIGRAPTVAEVGGAFADCFVSRLGFTDAVRG